LYDSQLSKPAQLLAKHPDFSFLCPHTPSQKPGPQSEARKKKKRRQRQTQCKKYTHPAHPRMLVYHPILTNAAIAVTNSNKKIKQAEKSAPFSPKNDSLTYLYN
jgi:hypothetical protein